VLKFEKKIRRQRVNTLINVTDFVNLYIKAQSTFRSREIIRWVKKCVLIWTNSKGKVIPYCVGVNVWRDVDLNQTIRGGRWANRRVGKENVLRIYFKRLLKEYRRCATSRKVPGSIPGSVIGDFFRGIRQVHVPEVNSAFRNEYQDFPGGKVCRCVGLTPLPP
jgi:hypothetical protein